jgi:hypothetical protein
MIKKIFSENQVSGKLSTAQFRSHVMIKIIKYGLYFGFLAGVGILLGCWIHGIRANQTTIMSQHAFIKELPIGDKLVDILFIQDGPIRTFKDFRSKNPNIQIDPEVAKKHEELYSTKRK